MTRVLPPAPSFLTDLSPSDQTWDKHRGEADRVAGAYRNVGYADLSERIKNCASWMRFAEHVDETGEARLKLADTRFCRARFCPICQWRKSKVWQARLSQAIPRLYEAVPDLVPIFLTLTVKNCHVSELRATIQRLTAAFGKLTRRKWWPGRAWVKSVEVTRNRAEQTCHPHLHALIWVGAEYFSTGYIHQSEWRSRWGEALLVDYLPVVNVKRVRGQTTSNSGVDQSLAGVLEVAKYAVKACEIVREPQYLADLTHQMHGLRSLDVGGLLKPYLRTDEPEDLINLEEEPETAPEPTRYFVARWSRESQKYYISDCYDSRPEEWDTG